MFENSELSEMSYVSYFANDSEIPLLPIEFSSPFSHSPHPIACLASEHLQTKLKNNNDLDHAFFLAGGGKMFGVLVVENCDGSVGYLSAFSGMLGGQWSVAGFVPPVFDENNIQKFLPAGEVDVSIFSEEIEALVNSSEYQRLKDALAEVKKKQEDAFFVFKKNLSEKKMMRKEMRTSLTSANGVDIERALMKLSFESQRDKDAKKAFCQSWAEKIQAAELCVSQFDSNIDALKRKRAKLSRTLQSQIFSHYQLHNVLGEQSLIAVFFDENKPPGGAGDCAAPKLLQFAIKNKLHPIAMAEFWWGAPPKDGVRHHKHYYPSCRGKCRPILPFMLTGIKVQPSPKYGNDFCDKSAPEIVYEDDDLLVVNKPGGLLSVPGKEVEDSVLMRIQLRYPNATGPLLVHRLDMDTSGVLLIAKTEAVHKILQRQFIDRRVKKRYVAILSRPLREGSVMKGSVELPLRVDLDDRPRQLVCYAHGKPALTYWALIDSFKEEPRLYFYPHTGRTHQLRLHAAHLDGLNAPIKGDKLYGNKADRLYLHAESLTFIHPANNQEITVVAPVPF